MTDSTADLPDDFYQENNIGCMFVPYLLNGVTYQEKNRLDPKEFYRLMRQEQAMPTTSQINPVQTLDYFRGWLKESKQILCLSFSSGLSGLYNSVAIAAQLAMEEDPQAKIIVIDSLCAELGEGMFVYTARQLQKQGLSMEENAAWLRENICHFAHVFTVDNLYHLYRGGRVSRATAAVGTVMNIKPLLHVDDTGHLIPVRNVRGRKKALNSLVDMMEEKTEGYTSPFDIVMIGHSDCEADALYVRDEVRRRFGRTNFLINYIGPTIGAHIGPDALTLFFFGKCR